LSPFSFLDPEAAEFLDEARHWFKAADLETKQ